MVANIPRVLLLAPKFWTSGTVTLARELQRGWPVDCPRPPIACPTRSGRPSSQWGRDVSEIKRAMSTTWRPDIVGSADDIIRIVRESFDIVHVTDPDITTDQRDWWYDLLERLPVPWTLTLNGNTYPNVPWDRIIASSMFTGVVWYTPGHVVDALINHKVKIIPLPRPYTLEYPIDAQLARTPHPLFHDDTVVGTHCRVAPTKGIAATLALSKHIGAQVCFDGAPQAGAIPYTLTIQHEYLYDDGMVPADARWTAETSRIGNGKVCYNGAFSDGVAVARHHDIHVSGTRLGFSAGHEYAVLEAIDAGCIIVQPEHMTESGCALVQYTYPWERRGVIGALDNEYRPLSNSVLSAIQHHKSWYDQSINRGQVASYHNPDRLIRTFYDEVLAAI